MKNNEFYYEFEVLKTWQKAEKTVEYVPWLNRKYLIESNGVILAFIILGVGAYFSDYIHSLIPIIVSFVLVFTIVYFQIKSDSKLLKTVPVINKIPYKIAFDKNEIVIINTKQPQRKLFSYQKIEDLVLEFHYEDEARNQPLSITISWNAKRKKYKYHFLTNEDYLINKIQHILQELYKNNIPFKEINNDTLALIASQEAIKPAPPINQKYLDLIDEIGKTDS